MPRRTDWLDLRALMAIRDLELRVRIVAQGFWRGLHRSPYHGVSSEFAEYRPYTHGDDPRYLDWRLYARTDRDYIKRFEEESNLSAYFVVDNSGSMRFGSEGYTKEQYAKTLVATLAYFLQQQGDATGLFLFDETLRRFCPARYQRGHLRRILLALAPEPSGRQTDLGAALERAAEQIRRRSLIVLVSDLLTPLAGWDRSLLRLAAAGHEIVVVRVLDPVEVEFSLQGGWVLADAESGRQMNIDPVAARREYLRSFQAHEQGLRDLCRLHGIRFRPTLTRTPIEESLYAFLGGGRRRTLRRTTRVGFRSAPVPPAA